MKVLKPDVKHIVEPNKIKLVERVARTCYKSEDLITEESAEKFVKGLIKSKHFAMLEHGNVIVTFDNPSALEMFRVSMSYDGFPFDPTYMRFTYNSPKNIFIMSGSFRAWRDLLLTKESTYYRYSFTICVLVAMYKKFPAIFEDIIETLKLNPVMLDNISYSEGYNTFKVYTNDDDFKKYCYEKGVELCEISKHLTHSMHFVCDRGVSHELVRHRNCAFAQESTRYCNYSKNKFGGEISVILPCFFDTGIGERSNSLVYKEWEASCKNSEETYFKLLEYGATPQQARTVLPNSLKTEIVVTANEEEWKHIFDLRLKGTTGAPHPQMKEVMEKCYYSYMHDLTDGRI